MLEKGLKKTGAGAEGEFQTWNDIFNSKIHSDIIISGSSRARVHINPQILDTTLHINSYNLGIEGYPFNMQNVRFKIFEKYNKKPLLVIQNVDLNTLYRRKAYNRIQFLPYLHEYSLNKELKKMEFSVFELYIPAFQYRSEFATICRGLAEFLNIKHYENRSRYKGYTGQDREWDGSKLQTILAGDSIVSPVDPEIVHLFDSFLNHCKKNDIQVILVFTPQYIKATEFTKNKKQVIDIYHSFSGKYNIPFLDYSYDSICYDTTYFYNAMHLNIKGAELFSLQLADDIKKLNIKLR
jgi:hypothetical protein